MYKIATGATLLGSALLLSACAPTGATAAVVNGVVITNSQVNSVAQGCATAINDSGLAAQEVTPDLIRADALQISILSEWAAQYVVDEAGEADGLADGESAASYLQNNEVSGEGLPTEEEMLGTIEQSQQTYLLESEDCAAAMLGLARHNVLAYTAGADYFNQASEIEVNPRFGNWDPATLTVAGSGSLSELAQR